MHIKNNFIPLSLLLLVTGLAGVFVYSLKLFTPFSLTSLKLSSIYRKIESHPQIYLLLYFIIACWFATAAFYNLARFRVPVLPVLAVFAGGFIQSSVLGIRFKNRKNIIKNTAALTASLFIVVYAYNFYRFFIEKNIMKIVRPYGTVSYLKDKIAVEDYGPVTFGSWALIPFEKGSVFQKNFRLKSKPDRKCSCSISLPVVWERGGKAVININGTDHTIKSQKRARTVYSFPVDTPQAIVIKLKHSTGKLYLTGDYQREYGRTLINGKPQNFELVAELYIRKKQIEKTKQSTSFREKNGY
jgi:hypothetical protein